MAIIRELLAVDGSSPNFAEGTVVGRTSTQLTLKGYYGTTSYLLGEGFSYNSMGQLVSGHFTGITVKFGGKVALQVTGLDATVDLLRKAPNIEAALFRGNDVFYGHADVADYFTMGAGNDIAYGDGGNDTLTGGAGNDDLRGGLGNDLLKGDAGNDTLTGGFGSDGLEGGAGADRFVFKGVSESSKGDRIADFSHVQGDKIDLSAIDANGAAKGEGAFKYIGAHDFGGTKGELQYSHGYLRADVNGDRVTDIEIWIKNGAALSKGDFIL